MVFSSQLRSRLLPILARRFTTTASRQEVHPAYAKHKETSKLFQKNDGLLVSIYRMLLVHHKGQSLKIYPILYLGHIFFYSIKRDRIG